MYRYIIRPFLFLFYAERIHHFIGSFLKAARRVPGKSKIFKWVYEVKDSRLEKELFGLKFPNPVGLAAGFDKNADMIDSMEMLGFGFIEIGTVTPKGQTGNPKPRIFRLVADEALINRMGFNNMGALEAVKQLKKRKSSIIIGGNLGKNTATSNDDAVADYVYVFEQLFDVVDYFVVNVSCPNVTDLCKLNNRDDLLGILNALQEKNKAKKNPKPILLKVAPDLNNDQLDDTIDIVNETGIQGVVATNTTVTRDNLSVDPQPYGNGGMSGKPLKGRSTEVIRYIKEKSNNAFPVIGVGGIMTPEDALEKIDAGADLLQIYSGFIYYGPKLVKHINKAILKRDYSNL